ncbi:hypothetical protein RHA1_ro08817 (plasmid) [Rhodococcus jostii RHA1]|jgi:hypothetical protein|uniref:NIPSNAP domain-containing protein n=1 Tax=Rhodococcus jostii (strain RHA1) TaxID=101510 RepID=Q0RXX5_RHOJR|nr:hypothetical protein [Rhodococcus jostii]ABG99861.1 hypothetical protein RHA1_ro08817 [Rhodococcus jostii RHA1]
MHVRVTRYRLLPGTTEKAMALVKEHWIPMIRDAEGFRGFELMVSETDELIGILRFQTGDQGLAALEQSREWVFHHFGDLLAQPSEVLMGTIELEAWPTKGPTGS